MDDVVYQENRLCLIIFGHICSWKFLKLRDFMSSQGGGTPQFVILQGGGTCGRCGISKNKLCLIIVGHNCRWKILKMSDFMVSQGGGTPQFVISHGGGTCG